MLPSGVAKTMPPSRFSLGSLVCYIVADFYRSALDVLGLDFELDSNF